MTDLFSRSSIDARYMSNKNTTFNPEGKINFKQKKISIYLIGKGDYDCDTLWPNMTSVHLKKSLFRQLDVWMYAKTYILKYVYHSDFFLVLAILNP